MAAMRRDGARVAVIPSDLQMNMECTRGCGGSTSGLATIQEQVSDTGTCQALKPSVVTSPQTRRRNAIDNCPAKTIGQHADATNYPLARLSSMAIIWREFEFARDCCSGA